MINPFLLSTAEIYPKVYHTCFFIVTYFAPLCLMVMAYIQICHKLWFQQVCIPEVMFVFKIYQVIHQLFQSRLFLWKLSMLHGCTYLLNRFLEARQYCRGNRDPCSTRHRVQLRESQWGADPTQPVLRSNRCELGARQLACWWWCSLFLHCVICRSAFSISWKGNLFQVQKPTDRSIIDAVIKQPDAE